MKSVNNLSMEDALSRALAYADIEKAKSRCLYCRLHEGLYHMVIWTAYMKYEFYVCANDGEIMGMDTRPVPYPEHLSLNRQSEYAPAHEGIITFPAQGTAR